MKNIFLAPVLAALAGLFAIGVTAAAHASTISVAVFDDSNYVNNAAGSDTQDLIQQLQSNTAVTTTTFSGITATSLTAGLAGSNVLIIPALDTADLNASMTNSEKAVIRSYVQGGNGLIILGDSHLRGPELVDNIFNFPTIGGPYNGPGSDFPLDTLGDAGTVFAVAANHAPATIGLNIGLYPVNTNTLPTGTENIYDEYVPFSNDTAICLLPNQVGADNIAFVGYNWTNGGPNGTQDSGWNSALNLTIEQVAGTVPEPSTMALLVFAAPALLILRRRKYADRKKNHMAEPYKK